MKILTFALLFAVFNVINAGQVLENGIYRELGQIMIGFVTSARERNSSALSPHNRRTACGPLNTGAALLMPVFRSEIAKWNANSSRFGDFKIGYDLVDSCKSASHAVGQARPWILQKVRRLRDDTLQPPPPLVVVGAYASRVTAPLAVMLQNFDIPLIDYGSTSTDLSDRKRYKLYGRTSPSDINQAQAIADMAKELGHKAVHLIYSEGLYGDLGARDVRKGLTKLGIALSSDQMAPTTRAPANFDTIVANLESSTDGSKAILCFCEDTSLRSLFRALKSANATKYQFIATDFWGEDMSIVEGFEDIAEDAITVTLGMGESDAGLDYNYVAATVQNEAQHDPWLKEILEQKYNCTLDDAMASDALAKCTNVQDFELTSDDFASSIYISTLLQTLEGVGQGLAKFIQQTCAKFADKSRCLTAINAGQAPEAVYRSILTSQSAKQQALFDSNGDGIPRYQFNWYSAENVPGNYVPIGTWIAGNLTMNEHFDRIPKF